MVKDKYKIFNHNQIKNIHQILLLDLDIIVIIIHHLIHHFKKVHLVVVVLEVKPKDLFKSNHKQNMRLRKRMENKGKKNLSLKRKSYHFYQEV